MKQLIYLLVFSFACILPGIPADAASPSMFVHFMDVGQGDSILIKTPEQQTVLIDGGEPGMGKQLAGYLRQQGITEIDLLIATHPDYDHIGGLNEVLRQFPVGRVIENGKVHPTKTYAMYRLLLLKKNIPFQVAEENEKISLENGVALHILHAADGGMREPNENSLAMKLSYGTVDFLLMGDVEAAEEKEIIEMHDVDAEILKVAHHGSDTSSTARFLNKVDPDVSIISYGEDNDYGHPAEEVIKALLKRDSQIFSTAGYGDIVVETNGEGYIVMPKMQPMERLIERLKLDK
jgi:beta-lactamase superfamily II metal-dependent hydrolase